MKKSWLIDSNVLVYSYDETVKQHDLSYSLATALDNGVNQVCTWNIKHLKKLSSLEVKTPREVLLF